MSRNKTLKGGSGGRGLIQSRTRYGRGGTTSFSKRNNGIVDESNLFYVEYNTRLTSSVLNAKKSEHGLISIKHATKRTDLIPSAANVVVVEGGDIEQIEQDPDVVFVESVPIYVEEQFNDPIANMSLQTSDFNRVDYLEAIEEFGAGEYYPMIGQREGQHQSYWYNNPDILENKVTNLNEPYQGANYAYAHHALEVASLMIAETNNNYGMASYCPNCTLGFVNTWATGVSLPEALEIFLENNIKVVNISAGGYTYSQVEQDAINDVYQQGVVIVASAGNDHNNNDANPHYPSDYDNVIGVAGSDYGNSNYGLQNLDVSAPSAGNLVAARGYNMGAGSCVDGMGNPTDPWGDDCFFRTTGGTSFGAPIVTALMGLLLSHNPDLTNVDLVDIVVSTIGSSIGNKPGEVNFYEALSYLYEVYPPEIPDIYGCTDSSACNYDSTATADDGTCWYAFLQCWDGAVVCYANECRKRKQKPLPYM